MNNRTSLLVSLLLFVFAVGFTEHADAAAPAPLMMCMGQPTPAGHVVTKVAHTAKCSGGAINTMWVTSYAGLNKFTACAPLTIPGYVVVAAARTPNCKGIGVSVQGNTVTFPTYDTVTVLKYEGLKTFSACAPLNIPSGYVVTGHTVTAGCKPYVGAVIQPWNTLTLSKYEGLATFAACMPLNSIPPGYVVIQQKRLPACGAAPGNNAVVLKRL